MGYFPNGSEAENYQATFCWKCVNWRDNGSGSEGCPIMDLHFIWNYDAVGKNADATKKRALDLFIPKEKDGIFNAECTMYQIRPAPTQAELERLGQGRLL